jgi:hypothetical protein
MKSRGILLAVGWLAVLLSGCATTPVLTVQQTGSLPATQPVQFYRIVRVNGAPAPTADLRTRRVLAHLEDALTLRGLTPAPAGIAADLAFEVFFGTDAPRTRLVARVNPLTQAQPWPTNQVVQPDPASEAPLLRNADGRIVTIEQTTERTKFIRLALLENAAEPGHALARQRWSVHVSNHDATDALESYAPLMFRAALDALSPLLPSRGVAAR